MGTLPTRGALYILAGAALIGVIGTLLTSNEPGFLLNLLIFLGSGAAALGVRRRSMYLLIPLPALLLFVTAVLTGAVHDSGTDSSNSALGVNFLQWIAGVFFGMCAATILVMVISGGRWLLSLQLVSGQIGTSASRGGGRGPRTAPVPGQSRARTDRDLQGRRAPREGEPRGTADPWDAHSPSAGQRAARAQGDGRDPWGDSRPPAEGRPPGDSRPPADSGPPADRGYPGAQPSGNQPPVSRPGPQPGGQQPSAQPGDRGYPGGSRPDGQPGDRGYPVGQQSGTNGRPGARALPPGRDQRDQRDRRDPGDPWETGGPRANRDRRDPWAQR